MSGLLTVEANSVAAAESSLSTAQPTTASEAEGAPAAGRHPSAQFRHAQGQNRAQGANKETSARHIGRPGIAPHAAGQFAPAGGNRLHSLPAAKARAPALRESNHFGLPGAAVNRGRVVPSPVVARGVGQSITAGSTMPARVATTPNAAARAPAIVGPQASRRGVLGGANLGRPTHNSSLDGSQLHRKF
jgi:hypothetical protein